MWGIMFLLRAILNILLRKASPRGPMSFGCLIFSLSGPWIIVVLYIDVCNCDVFSVVNVYLDRLKFCVVCIYGRSMSVVVNVMLFLMSVMSLSCTTYLCALW